MIRLGGRGQGPPHGGIARTRCGGAGIAPEIEAGSSSSYLGTRILRRVVEDIEGTVGMILDGGDRRSRDEGVFSVVQERGTRQASVHLKRRRGEESSRE